MVGALWTGISGLRGSQNGLDNESNNIANVNTIGYKASRVSFADQMYQDNIGKGVTSQDVEKMYKQGSLKLTGVSYDMALKQDGFFQVSDGLETYFTRAGNFRMGESGALEDVGAKKVQGWAMQPVTSDNIDSTDSNTSYFTNDFTKLLGNKVIRNETAIETVVAKATDYTQTATSDSSTIYTGAGYKSASTKISNIEMLMTEYNKALTQYSEANPKPASSASSVQKDLLNFDLGSKTLAEGDEVYIHIDGIKYSQTFDTDNATTMKKFADVLSNTAGFNAYLTNDTTSPYDLNTQGAPEKGIVVLEGLVPGSKYKITEFGWTDSSISNQVTKGSVVNIQEAIKGTGMGHINNIEDALSEAVAGKQMDVYDNLILGSHDFTYQIDIYNKELDINQTIPSTALTITAPVTVDNIVDAINTNTTATDELADYVKAYNINGNLVIKTLDKNNDVEFTGTLTGDKAGHSATPLIDKLVIGANATSTGDLQFTIDGNNYHTNITSGDSKATIAEKVSAAINTSLDSTADPKIASVIASGESVVITYTTSTSSTVALSAAETTTVGAPTSVVSVSTVAATTASSTANGIIGKNTNYSGIEGAGAEFLKITTNINQLSSKGDIQLRLDTLKLTDSAFGDFKVDSTGLITMQQDGAMFAVGQVAVAKFTDNRGLDPVGDNLLKATTRSGSAIFNVNNDKTSEIAGSTLELSTADLSESLVNLMVFQRAFEANAKSITTADQILTTLIQLKR